jgi:hypothetical protein
MPGIHQIMPQSLPFTSFPINYSLLSDHWMLYSWSCYRQTDELRVTLTGARGAALSWAWGLWVPARGVTLDLRLGDHSCLTRHHGTWPVRVAPLRAAQVMDSSVDTPCTQTTPAERRVRAESPNLTTKNVIMCCLLRVMAHVREKVKVTLCLTN